MIKNPLKFLLISFCLLTSLGVNSQIVSDYETRLTHLFQAIKTADTDTVRLQYNDSVKALFSKTLEMKESFIFPFDSLTYVGKITSDDAKLRLYTWNVVTDSGLVFNGFLQKLSGEVIPLKQSETAYKPTTKQVVLANNWYGALYYRAVAYKYKKQTVYMLVGWSQCDERTQYKVLDVLSFDEFGVARFGMPILFDEEKQSFTRAVFEYDAHIVMFLDYEPSPKRLLFAPLSPRKSLKAET